jgi:hypothetical protein
VYVFVPPNVHSVPNHLDYDRHDDDDSLKRVIEVDMKGQRKSKNVSNDTKCVPPSHQLIRFHSVTRKRCQERSKG